MSYAKLEFDADEQSDDEQEVEVVRSVESAATSYNLDTNIIELEEIENKSNQIEIIPDEETTKPQPKIHEKVLKFAKTHWFIIGLFSVILLAYLFPWVANKESPIHTPILVNYIAIPFAFICSGLSLPTNQIVKSFLKVKFHLLNLTFVFVIFPLAMYGYTSLLGLFNFNKTIRIGMAVMSAFPTTGATCVLLTRTAHGDDASALFTATLSNIIGVFISPTILYILLKSTVEISFVRVISNLMLTIMLPLATGQIIQKILQKIDEKLVKKIPTGYISNSLILFIVFTVFCDSFSSKAESLTFGTVVLTLVIMAFFFGIFSALVFGTTFVKFLNFSRSEKVACFYVSAQKTLGMGLPIIKLIYGNSPETSLVALPILVYHPTQLIVGSFFTGIFTKWVAGAAPDFVPMSTNA